MATRSTARPPKRTDATEMDRPVGISMLSDEELIAKTAVAENGRRFELLFEGAWTARALRRKYEPPRHAELALVTHLIWWTRHDRDQLRRLCERSGFGGDERGVYPRYYDKLVMAASDLLGDDSYDSDYDGASADELAIGETDSHSNQRFPDR